MATSIIKPVHAGIDFSFTIVVADWSSSSPYTYTWTNSAVTDGCRVEVDFSSASTNTDIMYLSYEKVSGGIQFTAPAKPTTAITVVVHVINAQTGNILAVTDEMVSSDAISGAANVNEALTMLNSNLTAHDGTFTKANNSYDVSYKISGNVHVISFSAINNSGFSTGFVDIATLSDVTLPISVFGNATDYTHDSFSYSRISSSNNKLQAYVVSSGCKQVVGTCVFIV